MDSLDVSMLYLMISSASYFSDSHPQIQYRTFLGLTTFHPTKTLPLGRLMSVRPFTLKSQLTHLQTVSPGLPES